MTKQTNRETSYGNWVSTKLLLVTGLLSCIFFGLSFLHISLIIPAILLLAAFFYFVYAYYLFSPAGANLQNRIRDLVLDHLAWDGRGEGLDVGCGNGPLVIKIAKKYPNCRVTGIDNWSKAWDYSQAECEKNARLERVMQRVVFKKANAAKLPFANETFNAVISNFVFHEVAEVSDKKMLVKEAIRVLKKGGAFSFQDLFLEKKIYGNPEDLLKRIKSWGVEKVELTKTNDLDFIPAVLKLPFMLGEIAIIHGKK